MKNTLINIVSGDGYPLEVMLSLPEGGPDSFVIYVNGSGPCTYNMKRQLPDGSTFNYHDLFSKEFTRRGIAYCRYSTRGVKECDAPPHFCEIDDEKYKTYLPHNLVIDIEHIVKYIKKEHPHVPVILLGWSEGSIIAPLAALNKNAAIDALLLCGYCNENLRDVLTWQLSGNSALITYRRLFDYDRKGYISGADFDEDRYHARAAVFGDSTFEQLDRDGDGRLTAADFAPEAQKHLAAMRSAIEEHDNEWLKINHGIQLTAEWFSEHFSLEPNKSVLPKLDIPIHIFSGEYDALTTELYARDIDERFAGLKKTNLTVHYFENHDHELNYLKYIIKNELSAGLTCLFNTAQEL